MRCLYNEKPPFVKSPLCPSANLIALSTLGLMLVKCGWGSVRTTTFGNSGSLPACILVDEAFSRKNAVVPC